MVFAPPNYALFRRRTDIPSPHGSELAATVVVVDSIGLGDT